RVLIGRSAAQGPAGRARLEDARDARWLGEHAGEPPAAPDARDRPNHLFHRIRCVDPRTAGLAPTGRSGDSELEIELVGIRGSVTENALPTLAHVRQALFHYLRRRAPGIEALQSDNADAFHPLHV